jgi:DNA-binding transcriptional regulator LsrR (DeoR family)
VRWAISSNSSQFQNLSEEEYRLCVRVALLYYENDLTQDEIGRKLGYSRVKINRVLRQSRDAGIVEIRIHSPADGLFRMEDDLMRKYGLRDVRIVATAKPGQDLYLALARGAAGWLSQNLEKGMVVGISLGRTVSYLPQVFRVGHLVDCIFTEVVGAASENFGGLVSYNVTTKLAELAGGRAELFYAPTFVSDPELKKKLIAEPSVDAALQRARQCQIIIQSVGPVDETALLFNFGQLNSDQLADLRRMGVVGDAMGHYFDRHGAHVKTLMDERVIGLDLEDLPRVPWSVVIGGGPEKVIPIDSALRGRLFNVLVTDEPTALALLEEKLDAE